MVFATVKILALIAVSLLLEGAFPGTWSRPDALLLWLVPWSLRCGRNFGGIVGFCGGVMLGCIGAVPCAVPAVVYAVAGYLLGWWGEREAIGFFVEWLGTLFAVVSVGFCLVLISRISPWALMPGESALRHWMWQALLWNSLLIWPAWRFVRYITRRITYHPVGWRI